MIVRSKDEALHLIRQPDHARLAAAIMAHCVALDARARRTSILRAVAEHDNGWMEEDETPLFDETSGVLDFVTAPKAIRQRVWRRGIARLAADPWPAALVAQHADAIYVRFHSDPEWASFFADVRHRRDALLAETGLSFEELVSDYAFVRLGDLISLAFCTGWIDEQRYGNVSVRLLGRRVIVTPDLFGNKVIPIEIAARAISRSRTRSAEELQMAWNSAPTVTLRGEVAAAELLTSNF